MAPTKDAQKLRRAAERKGKAEDQFQLGVLFYRGDEGLKQDLVAAAKWWSKAAAQWHADAQVHLEMMGRSDVPMPIATEPNPGADKRDVHARGLLRISTRRRRVDEPTQRVRETFHVFKEAQGFRPGPRERSQRVCLCARSL